MDKITSLKLSKLREFMKQAGADGAIIETWQNVTYFSDFTGFSDAVLFITAEKQYIITDARYYVQAAVQSPDYELVKARCDSLAAMKELIAKDNIKTVAYEDAGISYAMYRDYYKALGVSLIETANLFDKFRLIKNEKEIKAIKDACDCAAKAFADTVPYIKAGKTEVDIAGFLEYRMRALGASKPSFDTIVASGPRGAMPHGTATERKIEVGDGVTIDYGAWYNCYCSDQTRTVFVGEPSAKMREIYNVVRGGQKAAIDGFKPGMVGKDLDKIARDYITDAGYGQYFGHSLGHGVGINIHEKPAVASRSEEPLLPGMVFSVEPGVYVEGIGGVRVEDLVMINDGKLEVITNAPCRELTVLEP